MPDIPGIDKKDFCVRIDDLKGYVKNSSNEEIKDPSDFSKAKKKLEDQLKSKYPNQSITITSGSNFEVNGVKYVWHHHEDGRTMVPVRQVAHDVAKHSGGASAIKNNIQDVFKSPF